MCAWVGPCWHRLQLVQASLRDSPFWSPCTQQEESPIKDKGHNLHLCCWSLVLSVTLPDSALVGTTHRTFQAMESEVTEVEAWADPILYHQLAGEDWERCWQVLIWLYLEDNVNENWVLLLVRSKCRGRLRHLRKRREATWQEKKSHFMNMRVIMYCITFVFEFWVF